MQYATYKEEVNLRQTICVHLQNLPHGFGRFAYKRLQRLQSQVRKSEHDGHRSREFYLESRFKDLHSPNPERLQPMNGFTILLVYNPEANVQIRQGFNLLTPTCFFRFTFCSHRLEIASFTKRHNHENRPIDPTVRYYKNISPTRSAFFSFLKH